MEQENYDLCIIGAGVAGASLANALSGSSLKICIIEKDWREQDRIVGELLQPDGVKQLQQMGLSYLLEGYEAQSIAGYTIIHDNQQLQIAYPEGHTGRGLRNGKFVQTMRENLKNSEQICSIEAEVVDFIYENEAIKGVKIKASQNDVVTSITANMTIVSDGFFSKLRKKTTDNEEQLTGFFLGMILDDYTLPNNQHGHVFLTEKNPFLCYPISNSQARILIDFTDKIAPRKGAELILFLNQKIRPYLTPEMLTAFDITVAEGRFKVMPNHYMPSKERLLDGVLVIGDALNMRHPLTGGGMTVSLRDVNTLQLLLKENKLATTKDRMELAIAFYKTREQHVTVNILADALHNVMANDELKNACFDYLYKGGKKAEEPIALLSGLEKRKKVLAKHFFSVALAGGAKKIRSRKNVKSVKDAYKMMSDAYAIIYPLIKKRI
jgi:squalene monooxygenase